MFITYLKETKSVSYLLVDLSLQLHDLVLHAFVELLEMFH